MVTINRATARSIFVHLLSYNGSRVATATAFLVRNRANHIWLITNRHVVTGLHQETGEPLSSFGGIPYALRCALKVRSDVAPGGTTWVPVVIPLQDRDWNDLWCEHPELGPSVDVVGIPLSDLSLQSTTFVPDVTEADWVFHWMPAFQGTPASSDITLSSREMLYNLVDVLELDNMHDPYDSPETAELRPATEVQIIGFPIGFDPLDPAYLPLGIWCRGSIASEPEIDWGGRPRVLVDSRTRQGQSGSPVVAFQTYPYRDDDGQVQFPTGLHKGRLCGVYSGRLHEDSDLGFVWKISVVREIIARTDTDETA